jgi:heme exporter protein C
MGRTKALLGPARLGLALASAGIVLAILAHWMIFAWAPIEATQGVIQRIYYVHIPVAWLAELAFTMTALFSIAYLWLRDERADAAAMVSAEGGIYLACALLVVGPLWGRVAWGTYWTWEPRLTLTLLLFFIFIGYFMVRGATRDPDRGKRASAVVAIVGVLDIPLIHMSVYWFRSLHPEPVVLRPDGPTADARIVLTLLVSLAAYSLVFAGLWWFRYLAETGERQQVRRTPTLLPQGAP